MAFDQSYYDERKKELLQQIGDLINESWQDVMTLARKYQQKSQRINAKYNQVVLQEQESRKKEEEKKVKKDEKPKE